jgi:hypothetical protein
MPWPTASFPFRIESEKQIVGLRNAGEADVLIAPTTMVPSTTLLLGDAHVVKA